MRMHHIDFTRYIAQKAPAPIRQNQKRAMLESGFRTGTIPAWEKQDDGRKGRAGAIDRTAQELARKLPDRAEGEWK